MSWANSRKSFAEKQLDSMTLTLPEEFTSKCVKTETMVAAMKSQENVVRTLLGSRKVDINKHNSIGQNALLIAAMSKSGETIVRMMLCHPLIQVNVENDHGETPLLNAIRCYNPNIVDALLENEKVDPNYVSKNECIPFLEAVR